MKLAIISHTPHYRKGKEYVGWGPTIREINYLTRIFDEIYHIAPLHEGEQAPDSSLPYTESSIRFIPLKPYGGAGIKDKLKILTTAPFNLHQIKKILPKVDWVQFRAPTSMGLYVLPYLSLLKRKNKWVKYAGNWKQKKPAVSYAIQRWWLKNNLQNSFVTINGFWADQQKHLLSFANPCLTDHELEKGREITNRKEFDRPLKLLFVGRVEEEKGVDRIIQAIREYKNLDIIEKITIVGEGPKKQYFESQAKDIPANIEFLGALSRIDLINYFKEYHLLLLPSTASEGFPKVIAEAVNYGMVPVVSNVSSISHYIIHDKNGYVWSPEEQSFVNFFSGLNLHSEKLKSLSTKGYDLAKAFTFNMYNKRIKEEIIKG